MPAKAKIADSLVQLPVAEGHPIALEGSVTLASQEESPVEDAARLSNSTGYVMEISEIRFSLSTPGNNVSGGMVLCRLTLGDALKITKGYIPLASFCRSNQLYFSEQAFTGANISGGGLNDLLAFGDYVWRLPHPIYVPPGGILQPAFKHTGFIPDDITVKVTYLGRTLPGAYPKEFNLPYVAAWVCPAIDLSFQFDGSPLTTTAEQSSDEQDLANETDGTVHVESMVGRIFMSGGISGLVPAIPGDVTFLEDSDAGIDRLVFLTMRTSFGHDIIREDTPLPFRAVFGGATREMPCKITLPPKHYFNTTVQVVKAPEGRGVLPSALFPEISMIGFRKVVL